MSGVVIWLTGLPASGKSTLARALQARLRERGTQTAILDGDEVRAALVPTPGYSPSEREQFYETLARMAAVLARQGLTVIVAATAHRRVFRERARALSPRYLEVHVATPQEECARRDPKGLYAEARRHDGIPLPGLAEPYEPPLRPDVLATGGLDEQAIQTIVAAVNAPTDSPRPVESSSARS